MGKKYQINCERCRVITTTTSKPQIRQDRVRVKANKQLIRRENKESAERQDKQKDLDKKLAKAKKRWEAYKQDWENKNTHWYDWFIGGTPKPHAWDSFNWYLIMYEPKIHQLSSSLKFDIPWPFCTLSTLYYRCPMCKAKIFTN